MSAHALDQKVVWQLALPMQQKPQILTASTKQFVLIILFGGVIPAVLICLGLHSHDWDGTIRFWLESLGMYLAGFALIFAEKAARKSEQTEAQLITYGLSTSENRNEFQAIFTEHLALLCYVQNYFAEFREIPENSMERPGGFSSRIPGRNRVVLVRPFDSLAGREGAIHLLLSTPAYGYAAVGPKIFTLFPDSLPKVPDCALEMIFFSPDDHYSYWGNVLLWAAFRDAGFSEGFASGITNVFQKLQGRRDNVLTRVWVTRATTVREFAFFPKANNDDGESGRVYVALTDSFSLSHSNLLSR